MRTLILLLLVIVTTGVSAQFRMTFRKSFIDSFKNKLTISADYSIYHVGRVNSPARDGDIHFAGYDDVIGLSIVAEIMNARGEDEAIDLIREHDGDGQPGEPISVQGAWRIWSEHIAKGAHYSQGMEYENKGSSGPPHIFEIHPVTQVQDKDLLHTLRDIRGYTPKDGRTAFKHYSSLSSTITQTTRTITIQTKKAHYNYADFWIKIHSTEKYHVDDGLFVYCTVLDKGFRPGWREEDYLLNKKVRMAFVKDSGPYNLVKDMEADEYLHVIGIPRISLNEVRRRAQQSGSEASGLTINLPYEMIVVATKK